MKCFYDHGLEKNPLDCVVFKRSTRIVLIRDHGDYASKPAITSRISIMDSRRAGFCFADRTSRSWRVYLFGARWGRLAEWTYGRDIQQESSVGKQASMWDNTNILAQKRSRDIQNTRKVKREDSKDSSKKPFGSARSKWDERDFWPKLISFSLYPMSSRRHQKVQRAHSNKYIFKSLHRRSM